MPYSSFVIGPSKGLVRAELAAVPPLLVIVGPNGAGKSTLLYELQRQRNLATEGTKVLYLNPNRPWRRTTFNAAALYNLPYSLRDLYERESFPGWLNYQPPGFAGSGLPRSADNIDDVQGLVKFSLARLENRRRRAIADEFDRRGGEVPKGTLADAFSPLRELVRHLLPHLRFDRIEDAEGQNISCFFTKLDALEPTQVEMDDLSSGEKAVFQLFLPFVEAQIEAHIDGGSEDADLVAIIDEPEIHLHPALQVAMLTYLRELAESGRAQFILATHSTTIMDASEDEELYLLAPPASVGDGNQLVKLSANAERLDTVRTLTGSTYAVTRCRPIVFIEGERQSGARDVTDERLIEVLLPAAKGWVVVPGHGRSEAITAATTLRDPSMTQLPGMPVFALVDRDTFTGSPHDFVITWPVCMVENLLLDTEAIWDVIGPQREKVGMNSVSDVRHALEVIAAGRVDREVELRLQRRIPAFRAFERITSAVDLQDLPVRINDGVARFVAERGGPAAVEAAAAQVRAEVQDLLSGGRALEEFHGKEMLKTFYEQHAKRLGMSYVSFCYTVANAARGRSRLSTLVDRPARAISQFVPGGLGEVLRLVEEEVPSDQLPVDVARLRLEVAEARAHWEAGTDDPRDRRVLQASLSSLALQLKSLGRGPLQEALLRELALLAIG